MKRGRKQLHKRITRGIAAAAGITACLVLGMFVQAKGEIYREPMLSGTVETSICVGETFDKAALVNRILADDLEDGDLSYKIEEIFNDVNTAQLGEYTISYKVTDSDDNVTTLETIVNVVKDDTVPKTVQRKLYTLGDASHLTDINFNRGYYHDRQSLGIWLVENGTLEVRLVNAEEFGQDLKVTFINQDEKTQSEAIIPRSGEWVALKNVFEITNEEGTITEGSRESVPFIRTPKNTKVQPIIEFKWTEDTKEIPYYRYKDNEENFFAKWEESEAPYAIIEGSAATFLVPEDDKDNIINFSGVAYEEYGFDTIDEMLEWYAGFVTFYDEFVGLDFDAKEPYNQNLRAKFFIYANESGVGLAYYSADHSAFNGDSLDAYLSKSWLALHEFAHGYEGAIATREYAFTETTNNILAYHFLETYRTENDWGWLLEQFAGNTRDEKWANMEQRVLTMRGQASSFSEIVGEGVKAFDVSLYMFVNLLEKLGAKDGVQAMHSLYRELYYNTGEFAASGNVLAEGLGSVGNYNLIPYFSTFYIEPGAAVANEIYEKDYQILYYLKDILPEDSDAQAVKEQLKLSGVYSLVSTDDLAYTGYNSKVNIHFNMEDMEQIKNKIVLIKNGSKVVRAALITGDTISVELPIGAYEIEIPAPNTNVYTYGNEFVIAKKGEATVEISYRKETGNPLIDDTEIRLLGLGDNIFATLKTDSSENKIIWETVNAKPHDYLGESLYASVKILSPEGEEVYQQDMTGNALLENQQLVFECPIGTKVELYHMEADVRLWTVSNYTKKRIADYIPVQQPATLTYVMTEYGWMLEEWEEEKQKNVYLSILSEYSEYLISRMNSTDLQNKTKFHNEKMLLKLASASLDEARKQEYEEKWGVLVGKAPEYYVTYTKIDSETLTAQADTEQPQEGPDDCALDNNAATYWHTNYIDSSKAVDMENNINNGFTILLDKNTDIGKLEYLPRAEGNNGRIVKYDLYYSTTENEEDFQKIAISNNQWGKNGTLKSVEFYAPNARRIRICALETEGTEKNVFITAAEFYLYERNEKFMKGRDIYLGNLHHVYSTEEVTAPVINKNASGEKLTLQVEGEKKTFDYGIGLQGNTVVTYDFTNRPFDYFTAYVGIDTARETDATAKVNIYGDDRLLYVSGELAAHRNAEQIAVDIQDVKQLKILITDALENTQISLGDAKLYLQQDRTELLLQAGEITRIEENMSVYRDAEEWLSWSSENPDIAKVDANGNITAIAAGTTTITAVGKERTTICQVTVTAPAEEEKPAPDDTQKPDSGTKPDSGQTPGSGTTPDNNQKPDNGTNLPNKEESSNKAPKKGTLLTYKNITYKVTKAGLKNGTVAFVKPAKNAKTVTIPATIKVKGITYKVTAIEKNAFKNNKIVKKITIENNITTIGANAFMNCTALTNVQIGSKVSIIGEKAFYGCSKLTSINIPANVKKLGANVFVNCKKLKKITIQSKKFNKNNVAKNAFKGVIKSATIKVPKTKVAAYKKLFRSKGLNIRVVVKK